MVKEDPQKRILDAALMLFDRYGYAGTSMEDIRVAAGFRTKSSLYTHFSSKEAISAALFQKILEEEAKFLSPLLTDPAQTTMENVLAVSEQLVRWGLTHQPAYRFCFLQWHQDLPPVAETIHQALDAAPKWAGEVLAHLQKNTPELIRSWDPAVLVDACQGLINQSIVKAPPGLTREEIDERAQQTAVLCRAIVAP